MIPTASQASFPRIAVIQLLLSSLSQYPSLTKTASTGLVTLAEAMQDSATASEIQTIERGALVDESHIRLACLQAVQVRVELMRSSPLLIPSAAGPDHL